MTSKIASLWKKVEDSKQKSDAEKSAKKYKPKDKRVWISKGKIQSEGKEVLAPAPGKLIRSGTYEKISDDLQQSNHTQIQNSKTEEIKPRSRSRLSMKLSKFSLKRRGTGSMEDQVNGNTPVSPEEPLSPDYLGNSIAVLSPNDTELLTPDDTDRPDSDSVSPNIESGDSMSTGPDEVKLPMQPPRTQTFRSPNRSPASAIVAPFNYTPSTVAVQLKRNTSYVSSIGRKREDIPSGEDSDGEKKMLGSQTSSTMVTLV